MINLTIDDRPVQVPQGATVLDAARKCGVDIPTLCYLKDVQAIGACRLCVVEVEGAKALVPSCVAPATPGMKVYTKTKRVREARKLVMQLLMSDHAGECLTCDRNEKCEFQALARQMGIKQNDWTGDTSPRKFDHSTPALSRDSGKCVLCRRCVTVCKEVQGVTALFPQNRGFDTKVAPAFCQDLATVACVQCGQCAAVCPTGAITELDETDKVWAAIDHPDKFVVVQTAPAIRAALGEEFGYPPGTLVTGKMAAALRRLGFDAVFDTNFTADLTILEEGNELLMRLKAALAPEEFKKDGHHHAGPLPMATSCCPAWIKHAEYFHQDFLPNLSTCKSPQQMFGAAAKTYYSRRIAKHPTDVFVVSIMPCTAKKFECQRPEMESSWSRDVDVVLTTRELADMIKQAGIDFTSLPDEQMDAPMGMSSGAADIFANTGGVMEAALRTAYEVVTGRQLPFDGLHVTPITTLEGTKEAALTIRGCVPEWSFLEGKTLKIAVTHGLANANRLLEKIKSGEAEYHFIEVMSCPGGCIGGAGQPRMTTQAVRKARIEAIFREDEGKTMRKSHENPQIREAYEQFFKSPLGERSHQFLHTEYFGRERV
ncbi:MAG: NADH-dependent [FeFe] hydrogenase, group A6 [Myxococcota bacterium]|jgi:NADP-reducing hydrogenase subunit HndD|nr:[FeFe] hydrogenase, group A [Myxococcota bacterium]MBP8971302.1 [FeFe] hydrogenase, group A [Myxococcota bacterium]OQC42895.1 MAG: NADP-reducing hydrogenase subunit HndC [Deltaproteobacteria bacterium ADurb.Bin058]HHW97079.1 4Fe-4S binding protein [Oligoflexales bacterium]HQL57909.1 NADH-dependent [FeFe] hydrogenase, group A6 [Myxococcota bacterium]